MIPYGRQDIDPQDVAAVVETLTSDWLTQGPAVPAFEKALADYCGAAEAVAATSATSALHLVYLALGLGPGKRLWTTPNTFVATTNAALLCGASVDFVDIDPATYNLSVSALREKLAVADRKGLLPDVVTPVHFSGQPCDMREIRQLADRYGFKVVEDASHAVGADYLGAKVGRNVFADATVFSFHPVKLITTGEGGMVLTQDATLAHAMRLLRSHGITRDTALMQRQDEGAWYHEQLELGLNYRMTDIQAALGLSQLRRLDDFVAKRRALAARYDSLLASTDCICPEQASDGQSAWHLYVVQLPDGVSRRTVFDGMRASGIGVNVHYIPVYTQPYYQRLGFPQGYCPESERYYARALTLPLFPNLSTDQQGFVVQALLRQLG
ncbi:MAG: UDP-4-amino-4,6-dideoxy-N-acetyl-beta-L-altrosamine transaminase [Burkholderiales bacterium]|nr:UDP-4-amino-4,6-dideoxy-N-acetyl-beta-L-altrosamine transaminase [Burkholderiales bacterium]